MNRNLGTTHTHTKKKKEKKFQVNGIEHIFWAHHVFIQILRFYNLKYLGEQGRITGERKTREGNSSIQVIGNRTKK